MRIVWVVAALHVAVVITGDFMLYPYPRRRKLLVGEAHVNPIPLNDTLNGTSPDFNI